VNLLESAMSCARDLDARPTKSKAAPTVRRFLLEGLGCDRRADPIAYFEYEVLYEALGEARRLMELTGGVGVESLRLSPDDWLGELESVLAPTAAVAVPGLTTLRPGCEPKVRPGTCRLPTVGVVAVAHFGLSDDPSRSLGEVLGGLGIEPGMTSIQVLEEVDPRIRRLEEPTGLAALRDRLCPSIPGEDDLVDPITSRLLGALAEKYDGVAIGDLAGF